VCAPVVVVGDEAIKVVDLGPLVPVHQRSDRVDANDLSEAVSDLGIGKHQIVCATGGSLLVERKSSLLSRWRLD
jgi:hypothetical protein